MSNLARLDNSAMGGLQSTAQSIKRFIDLNDDISYNMALNEINKSPSFWERLFPNKYQRMQRDLTLTTMQDAHKARKLMFELYTATQLEITKQQGDAVIKAVGMHLQEELTQFAAQKMRSVESRIMEENEQFAEKIDRSFKDVEKYSHNPFLKNRYEQSVQKLTNDHFDFFNELLEGFINALKRESGKLP